MEKGKYKPNLDFITKLSSEFNVNLYYLIFGRGDMFTDPTQSLESNLESFTGDIEVVKKFLRYFKRSPIVRYLTLGHFHKIMRTDQQSIEKEVEEFETGTK
jgi:hypothetical protein